MSFWQKFLASFFSVTHQNTKLSNRSVCRYLDITSLDKDSQRAFKFGVLESTWILAELWRPFFSQKLTRNHLHTVKLIIPSINSHLEQQAVKKTISEISLQPVSIIERSVFLNQYLLRDKNYSALKLIIDLSTDFTEVSLFLDQEIVKKQTLNWGLSNFKELACNYCFDHFAIEVAKSELQKLLELSLSNEKAKAMIKGKDLLTGKMKSLELETAKLRKIYKQQLDRLLASLTLFIEELPVEILAKNWQHYYLFLAEFESSFLLDYLNSKLRLEGIAEKGALSDYA